ncbi:MAG: peptidylprolyl isomerase [Mucispirillum sp.]|nr:peptidylprolyl isomerase [Mucispirillum sp.]
MKKILAAVLSIAAITGCSKTENTVDTENSYDNGTAILNINGQTLYDRDFFNFAGVAIKELNTDDYDNKEIYEQLISNFIEHNLLLQEAERRNITIDETKTGAALESFLSESGAQDLKVYSGSYSTDPRVLSDLLHQRMKIENLIYDTINSNIDIKEADIKKAYDENFSTVSPVQKAHLLQIFTTNKSIAEKAMAELKRGLSFNEVASRYSEGPEKDNGGDLGLVIDSDYPEIFGEAFKLPAGKISEIIKSEYGYHIFLVKQYEKPKKIDYEQVKTQIHFTLYNKEQDEKIQELIDELYKKADIKRIGDIDLADFSKSAGGNNR